MRLIFLLFLLVGCAGAWQPGAEFNAIPVSGGGYDIFTYQKNLNDSDVVHIYLEGDGHAFDIWGAPTADPTPRGTMMRQLAMRDAAPNVAYIARPCQFIMSESCTESDWTDGRFSAHAVDAIADVIRKIAGGRSVVLIGYSGGAMVSGLVINRHREIHVKKWITIAGVLNHKMWTEYFGDAPLKKSLDLDKIPNVPQIHYCGARDDVVPVEITRKIVNDTDIVIVPGASHDGFADLHLDF